MPVTVPNKLLFLISVLAGALLFALADSEPWDSLYGWIGMAGLGMLLGVLGNGKPMLWPLGIFLGEVLYGTGRFAISLFFATGGGVNFFFPLGLLFLISFTVPALVGSCVGFGLRRALNKTLHPDTQTPPAG